MLTHMIDAEAKQIIIVAEGQQSRRTAASLELSHQILPTGEAVAILGGELDIATADAAVSYVTQVIDRHQGPVIVDLTALRFCDARGLSALLQIALHAEQGDHEFRVASASPSLVKLLRITGLDRRFPGATGREPKRSLRHAARARWPHEDCPPDRGGEAAFGASRDVIRSNRAGATSSLTAV
jgi:anti-sigma B factor antagonist